MNNVFIRPVYKVKDKLGRGETKVLYAALEEAAYVYVMSLLDTYGFKGTDFNITLDSTNKRVVIVPDCEDDYNDWIKILALPAVYVTGPIIGDVASKPVANSLSGYRYNRAELEAAGYNETVAPFNTIADIELVKVSRTDSEPVSLGEDPAPKFEEDPYSKDPPLVRVVDFDDTYDLPVNGVSSKSWLGRLFSYLGGLVAKTEGGLCEYRKPFILFESKLGGHIGIYNSLTTHNEVDVALFDSHGCLVNVFSFQDGCPIRNGINGFTIEDLIGLSSWRILHLNSFIPSEHNANAYGSLQDAITALGARSKERSK